MNYLKTHEVYITKLFLKNLLIATSIFACLIFILNILEELSFFRDLNLSLYYPIFFTFLNLPTLLFEIFPFIILITTQMFFMHLYSRDEVIIFKNYGIKNSDIIKIISKIVFIFGLFLVLGFNVISSSLKHNYLSFKNNFTEDNKYLAVINENGLWIKDEINGVINIVNAEKIEKNFLRNVSISQLDSNYNTVKTIFSNKVDINDKIWVISDPEIFEIDGKKFNPQTFLLKSNFNLKKINNLFSNLSSLSIYQLRDYYKDYKSLGYSTLDIESYINKLISLPFYLVLMIVIGSTLMLNVKHNKSKILYVVIGIMLSVIIYYINYFFNVMGTNERVPIIISVWFPLFILSLFTLMGLVKINDK